PDDSSFVTHTSPTQLLPLPLHDALPISNSIDFTKLDPSDLDDPSLTGYLANNIQPAASFGMVLRSTSGLNFGINPDVDRSTIPKDRKSTRLNSSHVKISYAVFCLKKKIK